MTTVFGVFFSLLFGLVIVYPHSGTVKELRARKTKTEISPTEHNDTKRGLIQKCPETWYDNRMPRVLGEGETIKTDEYVILDGKRVEVKQVDMDWVRKNCRVKKQTVS